MKKKSLFVGDYQGQRSKKHQWSNRCFPYPALVQSDFFRLGRAGPTGGAWGVERPPNNWKFFDFNFFFTRVNIQKY
jgi:hypothetical protein